MLGLAYSGCKRAVQEGTHSVGAPHDSASFNKGNIQNTEARGLVDTCRNWAVQEGKYGVDTPHDSARLNKGNSHNAEVREDSVAVACVVPDAAFQIHCLRRSAYAAALRAFCAQSDLFSRAKQECLAELRNELKISDTEHREYIVKASTNKHIKSLSAWLYKGNNGDAVLATESLDLKCGIPDCWRCCISDTLLGKISICLCVKSFFVLNRTSSHGITNASTHTMSPARNIDISDTSYSTTKGPCSDPDNFVPAKKLKSGNGSELANFKCPPRMEQLPEAISSVLLESSKHGPLDSKTSPCAMKAVCAVSPMFQGKHSQSNAGPFSWCVHKGMEASIKGGADASPMGRSKGLSVAITYSAGDVDHGSDIVKILLTSSLVNKVQELFNMKPDPAMLETAKSILKDQERHLMDALVKISEVLSASACRVHLVEHDEETPPPKPVSSSGTSISSITELRQAEVKRDVVETRRRELEPAAKRAWGPTVRVLESEWVESLSSKRKKRTGVVNNTVRRMRPVTMVNGGGGRPDSGYALVPCR